MAAPAPQQFKTSSSNNGKSRDFILPQVNCSKAGRQWRKKWILLDGHRQRPPLENRFDHSQHSDKTAIPMRLFSCFFLLFSAGTALPVLAAPPAAPSNLTVAAPGPTSVSLAWQDNSNNETGFEVSYREGANGGFIPLSLVIAANATVLNLNGAKPSTSYQFQVRACLGSPGECSAYAGPAGVTTPPAVSSTTFQAAYLQKSFSFNLTSTSPAQVTGYAITALPAGLTLNPTTGVISGVPTASGKTTALAAITHANGYIATAPLTLRVYIDPPALLPPVSGPALADRALVTGAGPAVISAGTLFTDPDVASAARLTTDLGPMDFVFFPESAPATVTNFLGYLNRGDFLNTIFHRSVPGFIIQGGAFRADATASAVPTQPVVVNEPNISNRRGTISMARTSIVNSATNQFFINLANNAGNLDNQNEGFAVFARVAGTGMTVADAIAALPQRNYTAINGAMAATPVRGTPPVSYDPAALVRINAAVPIPALTLSVTTAPAGVAGASLAGTDLTLTPLLPGTTRVTLTATDLDNQTAASSFQVTVSDSYAGWAARQAFASSAEALSGADPDLDGRLNFVEFALGSVPLQATSNDLVAGLAENHLTYTFPLRRFLSGATVTLQSAESPAGPWVNRWSSADGFIHPWIASTVTAGEADLVTARDPGALSLAKRFLRLKISQP
jgi:cyclophilin family peptidyl-prolyl cis-trans isomerase